MTLERITPGHPDYTPDYAACLPLAETIGRSAAFAVSRHGGDRADSAFDGWLADSGLILPDSLPVWECHLRTVVRLASVVRWSGLDRDSWGTDAIQHATTDQLARHSGQLSRLARMESRAVRWGVERDLYPGRLAIAGVHGNYTTERAGEYVESVAVVWDADRSERVESATRETALATLQEPDVSRYVALANRMRPTWATIVRAIRAQRFESFAGSATVRILPATVTVDSARDAWMRSGVEQSHRVANVWETSGQEGVARMLGIDTTDAIRTDDWLMMMRDTAIRNSWCADHHSLITRVTHATRQPFGVRMGGTVTLTVTLPDTAQPVTAFYGGNTIATPESLVSEFHSALAHRLQGARVSLAGNDTTTVDHTPEATRRAPWPTMAGDDSARGVDEEPDGERYYCECCDESYDPDDESHGEEFCQRCDESYCGQAESHDTFWCEHCSHWVCEREDHDATECECGTMVCPDTEDNEHMRSCLDCEEDYVCGNAHECEGSDDE